LTKPSYSILFENEDFVAVNKPSGLLSIPDRANEEISLKQLLIQRYGQIFTIHRLDKDTSGIILFAKNESAHHYFSRIFEERKIRKYYLGIVLGEPVPESGTMDGPIAENPATKGTMMIHRNGKPSRTDYRVLMGSRFFSMVEFELHTGRTHQIRVHAKNLGHPIACDPLYGDGKPVLISSFKKNYKLSKDTLEERPMISHLALHAYKLVFENEKGELIELCAPVPKEYNALLNQIKKLQG
jgi:23S rRNA pseudouridine955/2504/2580 synthase/23S rRNA pseudouridine1911/1915/1917 synthase